MPLPNGAGISAADPPESRPYVRWFLRAPPAGAVILYFTARWISTTPGKVTRLAVRDYGALTTQLAPLFKKSGKYDVRGLPLPIQYVKITCLL